MKSIVYIEEQCREYRSACDTLIGIIEEFEECTGIIHTDYQIETVGYQIRVIGEKGGWVYPLCVVNTRGCIYSYGVRRRGGGIGLQISNKTLQLHVPAVSSTLGVGVKTIGVGCIPVEDIYNIQPHEYGLLKLKYGLTKEELFIPTIVKDYIKGSKP